ncbi:N-6 DNA methylase, partial [Pseudanabaenaceae cyanobacterium LEGE 13415]|nr:N-6 DNA methylase [Pseudanabaenaceae cyanobacterium LEGE 13415]
MDAIEQGGSIFTTEIQILRGVILQAQLLRKQYWCVVANPPYMGNKSMNSHLKNFAETNYPDSKSDLFSVFVEHIIRMTLKDGYIGLMSPFTWMFLSSHEKLRKKLLNESTLLSLVRPEYHAFFDSAYVPICCFTLSRRVLFNYSGSFIDLTEFYGADLQPVKTLEAIFDPNCGYLYYAKPTDFAKIPGSPVAWISERELEAYSEGKILGSYSEPRKGLDTGYNDRFLRFWHETSIVNSSLSSDESISVSNTQLVKWFPYNKGGDFRKWYGNREYVINWRNDGQEIKSQLNNKTRKPTLRNQDYYFREGYTWTTVSSSKFSARYTLNDSLFDNGGCTLFSGTNLHVIGNFLNSKIAQRYLDFISPTLNYQPGDISRILYKPLEDRDLEYKVSEKALTLVEFSRFDWDSFESSWDFQIHPLIKDRNVYQLSLAFSNWKTATDQTFQEVKRLEEENNRFWIEAYGLQDELTPEVPDDQITIRRADRSRDIRSLISYGIGCI